MRRRTALAATCCPMARWTSIRKPGALMWNNASKPASLSSRQAARGRPSSRGRRIDLYVANHAHHHRRHRPGLSAAFDARADFLTLRAILLHELRPAALEGWRTLQMKAGGDHAS